MKRLLRRLHRPLVWMVMCLILGLIGGMIRENTSYHSFFMYMLIIVIGLFVYMYHTKRWIYIGLILIMAVGSISMQIHPVVTEQLAEGEQVILKGRIMDKGETPFYTVFLLDQVQQLQNNKIIPLKSKIKVLTNNSQELHLGEEILIKGQVKPLVKQYNPSDFDYGMYLKSQGIINEVQLEKIIKKWPYKGVRYKVKEQLQRQIELLFKGQDDGLVSALVLGEKGVLNPDTKILYEQLGIAHVLAISGLHMSVIALSIGWLLGRMNFNYTWRNILSVIGIWGYSLLVGTSVSVTRASIMLTVMLIVRVLWEEEDLLSSLALAAFIILMLNPFQLYQVGFQLSFMALLGVAFYQALYQFFKHECRWHQGKLKLVRLFLPTLCMSVFSMPILAYHFYEVSLLGLVLNVLIIPLFGVLVPLILITLLLSILALPLTSFFVYCVLAFLESIKSIGESLVNVPFATMITGRPSSLFYIMYYGGLGIVSLRVKQVWNKKIDYLIGLGTVLILGGLLRRQDLMEITHLYVGQGDCTVVTMPNGKTLLMDSGPKQSGKKVESYLKFKGKKQVDLVILSHPHEDHIGGLLYLMEQGYQIKAVMGAIPKGQEDEHMLELKKLCEENNIPLYEGYKGNKVQIEDISLKVLWPDKEMVYSNLNEASLVCLLKYGAFEELFTGDIGFETEEILEPDIEDIEVLKVPHHGSRYSTSSKFLEKLGAEYGMISAGVRNFYGHPNQSTLERLKENDTQIRRTDTQGALFIRTDGKQYTVQTHMQEEKTSESKGDYAHLW